MSISDAEKKWEKAKKVVNKSKYPENDSYYSVVTTVFKKMMHEELPKGILLNFDEFITSNHKNEFFKQIGDSNHKKTFSADLQNLNSASKNLGSLGDDIISNMKIM